MNLYVWRGKNVLKQYGSGIAFAFSPSADIARQLIRAQVIDYYDFLDPNDPDDKEQLDSYLEFLDNVPEIYYGNLTPIAFIQMGSE